MYINDCEYFMCNICRKSTGCGTFEVTEAEIRIFGIHRFDRRTSQPEGKCMFSHAITPPTRRVYIADGTSPRLMSPAVSG